MTREERMEKLATTVLRTCVADHRLHALLHKACDGETAEIHDAVQDIRERVWAAGEARDEAVAAYVDALDAEAVAPA